MTTDTIISTNLEAQLIVDDEVAGGANVYKSTGRGIVTKTRICIVVALVVASVAVLAIVLGLVFGLQKEDDAGTPFTPDLEMLRQTIEPNLNTSVDPCEDFFQFACGGFAGNATADRAQEFTDNVLQDILDNGLNNTQVEALQKTKQLYDSCLDTERVNALGVRPLLELIRETGGWALVGIPSTMPWDINGQSFMTEKQFGSSAFFDVSVSPDARDSSAWLLQLSQSGLTFPIEYYLDPRLVNLIRENLVYMIIEALLALNPNGDILNYEDAALNIWELERNISNIWVSNAAQREAENTYNRITIGDLSALWADYNWNINLPTFIRNAGGPVVDASEAINVQTPDYFRSLSDVFTTTDADTLENYAKWQLISEYLAYVDEDCAAIARRIKELSRPRRAATTERTRECIEFVNTVVPLALSNPYVQRVINDSVRETVRSVLNQVVGGLRERIQAVPWLDTTSRIATIQKLEAIEFVVGYPERILDTNFLNTFYEQLEVAKDYFGNYRRFLNFTQRQQFSLLRQRVDYNQFLDQFGISYATVNAFYIPNFNAITVLAAILASEPFYSSNWPYYFQYGTIGAVVGHEMGHGFDDQGRQFTLNGNLRQWWTDSAVQNYVDRLQCFVDQYSGYNMTFEEPNGTISIDGEMTLSENLADDTGLKSSFQAYKSLNLQEEGILNLTANQLFFVAWGQVWCEVLDPTDGVSFLIEVLTDVHSPGPIRVFAPMVNNPEFAEAYNCPVGSPMNPSNKCSLW